MLEILMKVQRKSPPHSRGSFTWVSEPKAALHPRFFSCSFHFNHNACIINANDYAFSSSFCTCTSGALCNLCKKNREFLKSSLKTCAIPQKKNVYVHRTKRSRSANMMMLSGSGLLCFFAKSGCGTRLLTENSHFLNEFGDRMENLR